jgi:transposase-like protein
MAGKYRRFSPEFREEAARMVVETSRAIADVVRELGINATSLGNWVRAYREQHAEHEPPLQVSGAGPAAGAGAAQPRAGDGERVPEKSSHVLCGGASVSDRYEFINAEYADGPAGGGPAPTITCMCKWLGVSKSGFYERRSRPDGATAERRKKLALIITKIFDDSDATYGYRRIAGQLAPMPDRPPAPGSPTAPRARRRPATLRIQRHTPATGPGRKRQRLHQSGPA